MSLRCSWLGTRRLDRFASVSVLRLLLLAVRRARTGRVSCESWKGNFGWKKTPLWTREAPSIMVATGILGFRSCLSPQCSEEGATGRAGFVRRTFVGSVTLRLSTEGLFCPSARSGMEALASWTLQSQTSFSPRVTRLHGWSSTGRFSRMQDSQFSIPGKSQAKQKVNS